MDEDAREINVKTSMLLAWAAISLSACQKSDPNICGSLPMRFPGVAVSADDQRQVLYSCMERWAARLSQSKQDGATDVAKAAVAACDEALRHYVYLFGKEGNFKIPLQDYPDISREEFWIERTRFIAVQTRAGDCYPDA